MKSLEHEIKEILLNIGQHIKIHKMDNESYIIDMDYDIYTIKIMELFKKYLNE
jgi:hypothetical protein